MKNRRIGRKWFLSVLGLTLLFAAGVSTFQSKTYAAAAYTSYTATYSGSYSGSPSNPGQAFDGNTSTYAQLAQSRGDAVGFNVNIPAGTSVYYAYYGNTNQSSSTIRVQLFDVSGNVVFDSSINITNAISTTDSNASTITAAATHGQISNTAANTSANVYELQLYGSPPDTTAPSVPTGVTATSTGTSSTHISWTAATDNVGVTGYKIYRNGSQIGTAAGTSYDDSGLTGGTSYSYTVAAYDAAGNTSAQSAAATVTTDTPPDTTPPAVPTGLTATAGDGQVTLNWTANTDDAVRYQIYKNGVYYNTASGIGTTSFVVTGLTNGTSYSFTITAQDAANNESAQSAAVTAAPKDMTAPAVPTGLTAAAGDGQVTLNWTANTDDTVTYLIFKNGVQIGTVNHPTATYKATGLSNGTNYSFTIAAQDANGNTSASTAAVTATPTAAPSPGTGIVYTGDYGFTATDIFKNAMELVKSLGPFLLLILSVIFAPKLIQLLRAAVAVYRRRRG